MPLPNNRHQMPLSPKMQALGLSMHYLHACDEFPIGNVLDPDTPANAARKVVETHLGDEFGSIYHLGLAHPCHNIVSYIGPCKTNGLFPADGLIVPRGDQPFCIATLVADCATIAIVNKTDVGFIHSGRPEVVGGVFQNFSRIWGFGIADTYGFVGPTISGRYYELESIPPGFEEFGCPTTWGAQGFDVPAAIERKLKVMGIDDHVTWSDVDPYDENLRGNTQWGSDQFYRVRKQDQKRPFSPRDCALLIYTPPAQTSAE